MCSLQEDYFYYEECCFVVDPCSCSSQQIFSHFGVVVGGFFNFTSGEKTGLGVKKCRYTMSSRCEEKRRLFVFAMDQHHLDGVEYLSST